MTTFNTPANRAWVALLAATAITWWLGESGAAGKTGTMAVLIMLGLALVKGWLVIYDFMELRHAPMLWKTLLLGWLVFVLGMIVLAYWMGLH
ncbi:MAG: cytochrome C oxidase subunit IV family protein [Proteobacteria bacterium]|jgi:hypothetical protein|nr:cytochrome C oxidase subunit IV family protein [Pseudomonadota bacterium]